MSINFNVYIFIGQRDNKIQCGKEACLKINKINKYVYVTGDFQDSNQNFKRDGRFARILGNLNRPPPLLKDFFKNGISYCGWKTCIRGNNTL